MMLESSKFLEKAFCSRYLVNQFPDAVFFLREDGLFLYLNDAACQLLEYSRQELLSMRLLDIDTNFSQKSWLEQWQSLKQQSSLVVKSQYRTRSGKLLPVELTLTYIKEEDYDFSRVVVRPVKETQPTQDVNSQSCSDSINDVDQKSQLREIEAQLAKTLSLVHGTSDSATYGTVTVSCEGKVLNYNQKFLEMWKIPDWLNLSEDSEERSNFFARQLENPEDFCRSVWEVSRESDDETCDILKLKDGREFAQYSKPQRLNGEIIGRVWGVWDVSQVEQQIQSKLQKNQEKIDKIEAIKEAKQTSEGKSQFLSILCHQFRSSLNVISFSNSLLKRYANKWTDNKKSPYLDNIQTAVEQISELLDELVLLGKSEVGQIDFKPKPTDIGGFCRDLIVRMQLLSDQKQQTINFLDCHNCESACVDENLFHQIFTRLLSNAIKYSPNGNKIEFEVLCEPEQIIINIKDKGIGITEVDRQRIFEPFFRGSNVDSIPGHGLGLSIVQNLVKIHGGEIDVESEVGVGTTFSFTLSTKSMAD